MGRRAIPMSEREHGVRATYVAGCRCADCTSAQSAYNARRREADKAARPVLPTLDEIRIPVSCPHCGKAVKQQTPSATTDSGLRVTLMLRCTGDGCRRQWQFVGVLMSLSGAEYMGAA